ncbi:hypothetical protein ACHAXT_004000 [Thalassiosira profunda]
MQRKRHGGPGSASPAAGDAHDDGGAAKQHKPAHLVFAPRLQAAFSPSTAKTTTHAYSKERKADAPAGYFLPGVPVVLKLILLSFVGFAVLVVLTAKGRHAHWRYRNAMRGAHMPVPLLEAWKHRDKRSGRAANIRNSGDEPGDRSADATRRMLDQPSRFVDSEKRLKKQLLQLLEKQKAEHKHKPSDPSQSTLGVKIANRYLGEDILPYPGSKGDEKEWEKKMERRKKELGATDAEEWEAIMQQYNEAMEDISHEDEHAAHVSDGQQIIEGRGGDSSTAKQQSKAIQPPKGTEQWPSPSAKAGADTTILLKPAFGTHRPSSDAILVFAEGYDLSIYLAFVESLASTGYDGDVVLSISVEEKLKPGVKEYLQSKNAESGGVNIVAYEVNWSCFKRSGEAAAGSGEGVNHCKMNNAFGDTSGNPIADPRDPRPVATARYEIYWIWSLQYRKESWLMLIDARDVWFQSSPFAELTAKGKVSGELHLFGENAEAVTIGTSNYNRRWLNEAYGKKAVEPFYDKPVICSGSTIGNEDAIETYLRAMVAEYDATLCKSKGCDQGFHNYLYYSGKLGLEDSGSAAVEGIAKVVVHEQGKGIINNLGALRTKPLKERGMYDAEKEIVINWDGSTSAVAHQYDRDKEVNVMVKGKKRQFEQKWKANKK